MGTFRNGLTAAERVIVFYGSVFGCFKESHKTVRCVLAEELLLYDLIM